MTLTYDTRINPICTIQSELIAQIDEELAMAIRVVADAGGTTQQTNKCVSGVTLL